MLINTIADTIYMSVHSFCFCYMLMLAMYMFFSKRSAFFEDIVPNTKLRRVLGINCLAWALTYVPSVCDLIYKDQNVLDYCYNLETMIDMGVAPFVLWMLLLLLQFPVNFKSVVLPFLSIEVILITAYVITRNESVVTAAVLLWVSIAIIFVSFYVRLLVKYNRHLSENYSDLENKEVKWLNNVQVFFAIYLALYVASDTARMHGLRYVSYIVSMFIWMYIVLHIDRQELVLNLWNKSDSVLIDDEPVDMPMAVNTEKKEEDDKSTDLSWVGDLLTTRCEEAQLYLQPDLSLAMLSQAIGTNRTYISRYFSNCGLTYYQYINSLRIKHAQALMAKMHVRDENSDSEDGAASININDIARRSGFKSETTFRRAFMEKMGCLPSQYQPSDSKEIYMEQ